MDGMCRTRFRLCALAVGLVVLALPARSRTAFAWAAGDGYYSLINRHSGSALDVIGASTESGAAVIQYLGHLNANQQWLLREVVATPQVTTADAIRFLEQATLGPTPELVAHVQSVGFEQFLNEQFDAPVSSYPTLPLYPTTRDTVACPSGSACQRDNYTMYPLQNRFFVNALYGADQLRQRVAFALHQILVVSGVDITQPSWMAPYLQMLDRNAFGNYRQLLYEITLNPAMGNYLDIAGNTEDAPERELRARDPAAVLDRHRPAESGRHASSSMSTGQPIPTYTQDDGQQLRARVHRLAAGRRAGAGRAELHRSDGRQPERSTTSAPRRC